MLTVSQQMHVIILMGGISIILLLDNLGRIHRLTRELPWSISVALNLHSNCSIDDSLFTLIVCLCQLWERNAPAAHPSEEQQKCDGLHDKYQGKTGGRTHHSESADQRISSNNSADRSGELRH